MMSTSSGLSSSSSIDSLVAQYMAIERRPLNALTSQKSGMNVRLGMYTDLKAKLSGLESLAEDRGLRRRVRPLQFSDQAAGYGHDDEEHR